MASEQTQTPEMDNVIYVQLPKFDFVAREVADLTYTRPSTDPYDALETAVISRTAYSDEQNLRELLSGVDVGDKTPSQNLRHMMHLQGKHPVNDAALKELWQQSLPVEFRKVLSVIEQDSSLAKLAEMTDHVHETCKQFVVSNFQQPSTSQSNLELEFNSMKAQFDELPLQLNEVTKLISRLEQSRRSGFLSHGRTPKHRDPPGWCYYHCCFGAGEKIPQILFLAGSDTFACTCAYDTLLRLLDSRGNQRQMSQLCLTWFVSVKKDEPLDPVSDCELNGQVYAAKQRPLDGSIPPNGEKCFHTFFGADIANAFVMHAPSPLAFQTTPYPVDGIGTQFPQAQYAEGANDSPPDYIKSATELSNILQPYINLSAPYQDERDSEKPDPTKLMTATNQSDIHQQDPLTIFSPPLGPDPVLSTCPICRQNVETKVEYTDGWLLAVASCRSSASVQKMFRTLVRIVGIVWVSIIGCDWNAVKTHDSHRC
ncbi:hypothetical protein CLF_104393, partial [Clonorchis sinensis]